VNYEKKQKGVLFYETPCVLKVDKTDFVVLFFNTDMLLFLATQYRGLVNCWDQQMFILLFIFYHSFHCIFFKIFLL